MLLDASLVLADLQFALPVVLGVLVLIACKQAARTTAADRSDPLSSVGVPTETRRLPSADERGIVAVVLTRTLPRYSFLSSVLVILALTHLVALILLLVWFLPASPPPALPVFTAVSGVVLSLAAAGLVRARRSVQFSIKAFVWASWLGELAMSIERVYLFVKCNSRLPTAAFPLPFFFHFSLLSIRLVFLSLALWIVHHPAQEFLPAPLPRGARRAGSDEENRPLIGEHEDEGNRAEEQANDLPAYGTFGGASQPGQDGVVDGESKPASKPPSTASVKAASQHSTRSSHASTATPRASSVATPAEIETEPKEQQKEQEQVDTKNTVAAPKSTSDTAAPTFAEVVAGGASTTTTANPAIVSVLAPASTPDHVIKQPLNGVPGAPELSAAPPATPSKPASPPRPAPQQHTETIAFPTLPSISREASSSSIISSPPLGGRGSLDASARPSSFSSTHSIASSTANHGTSSPDKSKSRTRLTSLSEIGRRVSDEGKGIGRRISALARNNSSSSNLSGKAETSSGGPMEDEQQSSPAVRSASPGPGSPGRTGGSPGIVRKLSLMARGKSAKKEEQSQQEVQTVAPATEGTAAPEAVGQPKHQQQAHKIGGDGGANSSKKKKNKTGRNGKGKKVSKRK